MTASLRRHVIYRTSFSIFKNKFYEVEQYRLFRTTCIALKKNLKRSKGVTTSSQSWLQRQINDPYVRQAKFDHWRCRSAFKLLQMDDKHHFLKPGAVVIDCGAAPGSWSQVAVKRVNSMGQEPGLAVGKVIGVDLQHMQSLDGATLIHQADFTSLETQASMKQILEGKLADVILSDMAPNATGVKSMDHENIIDLCVSVVKFSKTVVKEGGTLLCKIWQGNCQGVLEKVIEDNFAMWRILRPPASRKESSEVFVFARGFKN